MSRNPPARAPQVAHPDVEVLIPFASPKDSRTGISASILNRVLSELISSTWPFRFERIALKDPT